MNRASDVPAVDRADTELVRDLHKQLRALAAGFLQHERPGHTLQPTALANEAYIRLRKSRNLDVLDRASFGAAAAGVIRQILVDHARGKKRIKRRTPERRIEIDLVEFCDRSVQILELHEALSAFAAISARAARVIELHYFGGLDHAEIGSVLGISARASQVDCRKGLAWLLATLSP